MNKQVIRVGLLALSFLFMHVSHAHNMFCLDSAMIPSPEPAQLKCSYHYRYTTSDLKTCYIQFTLGNGINLVPQSTLGITSGIIDLGTIAIKADMFGVQDKTAAVPATTSAKHLSVSESTAHMQRQGFQSFNRYTASNLGIALAVKFEPDTIPPVNVARLYQRDNIPTNMTLEQLQAVIGLGRVAETLPDLINKMQVIKIKNCTLNMP